jgi:Flp pilus assembly protein TadD
MKSPLTITQNLDISTTSSQAWQVADLYLKVGRLNQSLVVAYNIVQKDPGQQSIYTKYCLTAIQLGAEFAEEIGDYAKAAFYWEQLTKQVPQNVEAWHGLAVAKANLGDFRGAELAVGQALRIEPKNQKLRQLLSKVQAHR